MQRSHRKKMMMLLVVAVVICFVSFFVFSDERFFRLKKTDSFPVLFSFL